MLQVAGPKSVLNASKNMMRFCYKKNKELSLVVDYYENRITGTKVVLEFNKLVRKGLRSGKMREATAFPNYLDAKRQVARFRGLKSVAARRAKLNSQSN